MKVGGLGAAISAGPAIFWSPNEGDPLEQRGDFTTHVFASPLVTVGVDRSPDGYTTNISVGGPSIGLGYFKFKTSTAKPWIVASNVPGGCPNQPYSAR